MGIFDRIKKLTGTEKEDSKVTMKICMLGARGVGKTSVLTAMYGNTTQAVKATNMFINADDATHMILKNKEAELKQMFKPGNHFSDQVNSGIAASMTETVFSFTFGLTTDKVNLGLEIRDYPGEYVRIKPETVKSYIAESSAIILAIDTPCLMEENGRFHEVKNRAGRITDFFEQTITQNMDEKLIMLVPLKCEKYFREQRIDEVTERVCESYQKLLSFLQDKENSRGLKGKFACVIAPIETLGEIVFDDFERKEGEVITEEFEGEIYPEKVKYKYAHSSAVYKPHYCEQPLLYLLSFVTKQYYNLKQGGKDNKSGGFLKKLKDTFAPTPKSDELMKEIGKLTMKKNYNRDGYKVLFGMGKVR